MFLFVFCLFSSFLFFFFSFLFFSFLFFSCLLLFSFSFDFSPFQPLLHKVLIHTQRKLLCWIVMDIIVVVVVVVVVAVWL